MTCSHLGNSQGARLWQGAHLSNNGLSRVHSADSNWHNQPLIYFLDFSTSLEKRWSGLHLKDGDHEVQNNNRPISLLPVLSKVAERIALAQFNNYLTQKNRLTCHQSGNRKHHSTGTLSLLVSDHIFSAMVKKQITAMMRIDVSKAFNVIQPL